MKLKLKIWKQNTKDSKGKLVSYVLSNIKKDMSFLEMLDVLNDKLEREGKEAIAFDHDCREGICGTCSLMINGKPHGGQKKTATCQLHMRHFQDGQIVVIEPFRAKAFPVLKDLIVDRGAFDKIQQAGAYTSVNTGSAPDANSIIIEKRKADQAFDAAACIGCGACVAACKNASAMLFVSAKVSQYALLPQGQLEAKSRVLKMVKTMDEQQFGHCTNEKECEAACPKEIRADNIIKLNQEYLKASFLG